MFNSIFPSSSFLYPSYWRGAWSWFNYDDCIAEIATFLTIPTGPRWLAYKALRYEGRCKKGTTTGLRVINLFESSEKVKPSSIKKIRRPKTSSKHSCGGYIWLENTFDVLEVLGRIVMLQGGEGR